MTTLSCLSRAFAACIFLLLSPLAAALAPTSPGFPDPTYGSNGALIFGVRTGNESAAAIAPTPDGKWLVSGRAENAGGGGFVRYLMRLQPDGRPDLAFGTNGFVTDNYSSDIIAVQATGKILAATGQVGGGFQRAVLRRLASNGSLDPNFGVANGQTVLDTTTAQLPNQQFDSFEQDAQGRILATTRRRNESYSASEVEVWRFSAEGVPDPTFGNLGSVQVTDLPPVAYNSIVRPQADGKIVVATWCQPGGGRTDVCVIRFNANGTRDASFGPNGLRQIVAPPPLSYPIYDLRIDANGKIYISGTAFSSPAAVAAIFRLNADGTPDAGYGTGGMAKITFAGQTAYASRLHLLPDGRQIVIGGVSAGNAQYYGYTARLNPNGLLDATFGNAGVSPKVSAQAHWFDAGVVLADGAILAIGSLTTVPGGSSDDTDSLLARIVGVETTSQVIEFFNTILNHFFITADPVEAASIDSGASGPGWMRTSNTFRSGGPSRVCRLYGSPEIDPATGMRRGPNSHVYSIEAAECLAIRADPGWRFESYDFSGWLRLSATCPAGTVGVYRAYNNRFAQNDSNHRYTTEIAIYNAMLALGWLGEGIVFCAVE